MKGPHRPQSPKRPHTVSDIRAVAEPEQIQEFADFADMDHGAEADQAQRLVEPSVDETPASEP